MGSVRPRISVDIEESTGSEASFRRSEEGWKALVDSFREQEGISEEVLFELCDLGDPILRKLPNVANVRFGSSGSLIIVGDLHGQFFDLMKIFSVHGFPSESRPFLFLGDYVDRGSFGIETFFSLLAALTVWGPNAITILRGNHETADMCSMGGFMEECIAKYSRALFDRVLRTFSLLPIASLISNGLSGKMEKRGFAVHGGLFRDGTGGATMCIGPLSSIRKLKREVLNPPWESQLEDLLWSDPRLENGVSANSMRGAGVHWGPKESEAFLRSNRLCILVRAHEGPDARIKRPHMPGQMKAGWSVDHSTASGRVITLFSAANYPQGSGSGNRGAILILQKDFKTRFEEFTVANHPDAPVYSTMSTPVGAQQFM